MANPGERLSHDAHYVDATARLFGWRVAWEIDGSARMSRGDWTVRARFDADGAFRSGRAAGPGTGNLDLSLAEVVTALEQRGDPGERPPGRRLLGPPRPR